MIETSHNRETFFLLPLVPDWSSPVRVTFRRPVHIEAGLTEREVRRPTGNSVRINQEFRIEASGDEARKLEAWLATLKVETVAVPFWPGLTEAGSVDGVFTSRVSIAFSSDFTRWELWEVRPPSWALSEGYVAPLVFGRLDGRSFEWQTPQHLSASVNHVETSDASREVKVTPQTFEAGPFHDPGATASRLLFPSRVNFDRPGQTQRVTVDRDEIGFGRTPGETAWANPVREFSVEAVADGRLELGRMVSFFADHSSAVPFWVPAQSQALTLVQDLGPSSVKIYGVPGHGLASGDWLGFQTGGQFQAFAKVATVTESVVELANPPGALHRGETLATRLALCRFKSDRLVVEFDSPDVATASIDLRELSPETEFPNGESGGVTIGDAPGRVYLYRLETDTDAELLTSFESPLWYAGELYAAALVTHGEIESSTDISRNSVTITCGLQASGIARSFLSRSVTGSVRIQVIEAEIIGDQVANPVTLFAGELSSVSRTGLTLSLPCSPWGRLLDRPLPRVRVQPTCNNVLFDPGCALSKGDWAHSATMGNPGPSGFPFTFPVSGLVRIVGAAPTYSADWFAGGWVEIGFDRIAIRASTNPSAGALTLTLARDPRPYPFAGSTVYLYPGCDGRIETCADKFANRDNFLGHPFVPAANPSLVKLSTAFNGGKK